MPDTSVQLQINGRVQGVGFRAWLQQLAGTLGLKGWVRNRHDGWVEAVLSGPDHALDPALALIERGPPGSRVEDVAVRPADVSELAMIDGEQFAILPDL
jgi:acylphosphatase